MSDTGYGGSVAGGGSFTAEVPLDLPPARGGIPLPLRITYGARGVGAVGLGWDIPLSYIQSDRSFAWRRPTSLPRAPPEGRVKTTLSLLGQVVDLLAEGDHWVARNGTLTLLVRKIDQEWLVYDGIGDVYRFARPAALANTGLWLLQSIQGPNSGKVLLTYETSSQPLNGGTGTAVDLTRLDYNSNASMSCTKNAVTLAYANVSTTPLSMAVLGNSIWVRARTLSGIDVQSRENCATPYKRLRRYQFHYMAPDSDSPSPRLDHVEMLGREDTLEENTALTVANYRYGALTENGKLNFEHAQSIPMPPDWLNAGIAGTMWDPALNSGPQHYSMGQDLIDVTGDGRPDLVFKRNAKLWVALNQPGSDGKTTIGANALAIVPLSDATLTSDALAAQSSTAKRYAYGPANRNTTDIWRTQIDINGDGRIDIIDAHEEPDRWIVYLNTPGANGAVKWERRSLSVKLIRQALVRAGHVFDGAYLPLSRRATGTDIRIWECWKWNDQSKAWDWDDADFGHRCEGSSQQILGYGSERTFIEWDFVDFNGDGYPDFVYNSSPVDFQVNPPDVRGYPGAIFPTDFGNAGPYWRSFSPNIGNSIHIAYNVLGIRFANDDDPFSAPTELAVPGADWGVAAWSCSGSYPTDHTPCDDSSQSQVAGFADVNGDGLIDRVEAERAYLGTFAAAGGAFSPIYLSLPGVLATVKNTHKKECSAGGNLKPTSNQTNGIRDINGDGIPDYFENVGNPGNGRVWLGTGTGFSQAIDIQTTDGDFKFSHQTEDCEGITSFTDGGLFDIDGDGRPEIVGTVGNTLTIAQLSVNHVHGVPDANRLTLIDNGYGALTSIGYVSAKLYTDNSLPFPEIVVTSITTQDTLGLGGSLGGAKYAYSDAALVFDSVFDRFVFPGYGRTVQVSIYGSEDAKTLGNATITDSWPLTSITLATPKLERWLRWQRVGRIRDVLKLHGGSGTDPWSLLSVNEFDPRVAGADHYVWNAKLYETPLLASENIFDCLDFSNPLDYESTLAHLNSQSPDMCRSHGFGYLASVSTWYGSAAPPSADNVQTRTRILATDDFGRPLQTYYDNDLYRGDDDVCVENGYAKPSPQGNRILSALASRRMYDCGKGTTLARDIYTYDNLPQGAVSRGLMSSHSIERHAADTGALLNDVRVFDAIYDAQGNVRRVTTRRAAASRVVDLSYDEFGLVLTQLKVRASGVPTSTAAYQYDGVSLDQLVQTDPDQSRHEMKFDGFGRKVMDLIATSGDPAGVISTTSYLGFSAVDPLGRRILRTEFSDPVAPDDVQQTLGRSLTVWLDELGRERRGELALGADYQDQKLILGERHYDSLGRIAFEADTHSSADTEPLYGTTYNFTDVGQPDCAIRGFGQQLQTQSSDSASQHFPTCFQSSFAAHQMTLTVQDAASLDSNSPQAGVVKLATSTGSGRIVERSAERFGQRLELTRFGYDALGQLSSMSRYLDPVNAAEPVIWRWHRDSFGQLLSLDEPESATRYFSYSIWGELKAQTWMDGAVKRQVQLTYDALGRLAKSIERNNGIAEPESEQTYEYDHAFPLSTLLPPTNVRGRLAYAKSPSGEVSFSYDGLGHLAGKAFKDPSGDIYVQRSHFHADGGLADLQMYLPDDQVGAETFKYAYDSAGRLRHVNFARDTETQELFDAQSIDALGHVLKSSHGPSLSYQAAYAENGRRLIQEARIESAAGRREVNFDRYDALGRELMRHESKDGLPGTKTNVAYDALGQIAFTAKSQGPTDIEDWSYSYDSLGNISRLQDEVGNAGALISYRPVDRDRLCHVSYGPNATFGHCNVIHDAVGNVISQPTRNGSRQMTYFDSGGIRSLSEGAALASFRYDPFGNLQELSVHEGANNTRRVRYYGNLFERRDDGLDNSVILRHIPGVSGALATRWGVAGDWLFAFSELQGNRFFANQIGKWVQDIDYQPYGEASSTGVSANAADYTNAQWNGGSLLEPFGVNLLGSRLYDPVIGRFLSRDPVLLARGSRGSNPYSFAMNDPRNAADPSGLDCTGADCNQLSAQNSPDTGSVSGVWAGVAGLAAGGIGWALGQLTQGNTAQQQGVAAPNLTAFPGAQTSAGAVLLVASVARNGYAPRNYNFDAAARSGESAQTTLDRVTEVYSPERDAAIDAHNAKYNTLGSFSAGFGDAVWFWCPGCGGHARQTYGITTGDADQWAYTIGSITGIVGLISAPHPTAAGEPPTTGCAGGSCRVLCSLVAGTPIATQNGESKIEQIRLGDRVQPAGAQCPLELPKNLAAISLQIPDPQNAGGVVDIKLLRSPSWLAERRTQDGKIWLELGEIGYSGWAKVLGVASAPAVKAGAGCAVTMTLQHVSKEIDRLDLANTDVIELTPSHRLFVEDAGWTAVSSIVPGQYLRSEHGPQQVISVSPGLPNQTVFNIEVSGAHTYQVGREEIWSHNACIPGKNVRGASVRALALYDEDFGNAFRKLGQALYEGEAKEYEGGNRLLRFTSAYEKFQKLAAGSAGDWQRLAEAMLERVQVLMDRNELTGEELIWLDQIASKLQRF